MSMKTQRRTAWRSAKVAARIWCAELSIPKWSAFNNISNSLAARSTILIPLIGYLIIFNEYVVKYLDLVVELGGSKASDPVTISPRLLLVYFGLCELHPVLLTPA